MNKLRDFTSRHPRLARWAVLAVGMVIILLFAAKGKGLEPGQLLGLVGATIALAGACAWIIGLE